MTDLIIIPSNKSGTCTYMHKSLDIDIWFQKKVDGKKYFVVYI